MSDSEPRAHAPRLPDFLSTPAPEAPPHPDAELLALADAALTAGLLHERVKAEYIAWLHSPLKPGEPAAAQKVFRERYKPVEQTRALMVPAYQKASRLPATTPAGLLAKALLVRASKTGAPILARSLAIDLVESPALRAALWPPSGAGE